MRAKEQLEDLLARAAELNLPVTSLEVAPSFYDALWYELTALFLGRPPRYDTGGISYHGPTGVVLVRPTPRP